jgi:hypothetical protein
MKYVGALTPVISQLLAATQTIGSDTANWINLAAGVAGVFRIPRISTGNAPLTPRTLELSLDCTVKTEPRAL